MMGNCWWWQRRRVPSYSLKASPWSCLCLPTSCTGETLDLAWFRRRRHHGVAPFLKAPPRFLMVFHKRRMESQLATAESVGFEGARYTMVSFVDDIFSQSGRILPFTRHLSRHLWVRCTLVRAFWSRNYSTEDFFFGRGATLGPCALPPRHFGRRRCKASLRYHVLWVGVVGRVVLSSCCSNF
jgi:hypothetical protein